MTKEKLNDMKIRVQLKSSTEIIIVINDNELFNMNMRK